MANRFWVGGAATWDATAGTKWALTSGGAGGQAVPTAADDVFFDAASGANTVTLSASSVARSINCTGFTGTLSHPAATTISIGDATAGASNIALKFVAGMTYTLGNVSTSALSFVSTSATQQTVDFGGKAVGNLNFTGAGGNWALISAISQDPLGAITHTAGTLQWDGVSNNSGLSHSFGLVTCTGSTARSTNFGTSTTTATRSTTATHFQFSGTNLTFSGASATFVGTPSSTGRITYTYLFPVGSVIGTLILNGEGERSVGNNSTGYTVGTLTRNGTANKYEQLNIVAQGSLTVTNALNIISADAINRITVWPNSTALAATLVLAGATRNCQYVDWQDIIFNNGGANLDLSGDVGGSGDCGGNTIVGGGTLTFTTPTTQTWNSTGAGLWSDVSKWTSRVPLAQDNVVLGTMVGSPTIQCDKKWPCRNLTCTGTGNFTLLAASYECYITGNFVGRAGLTMTVSSSTWIMSPRANYTWTFNGMNTPVISSAWQVGVGSTLTFADTGNIGGSVTHRCGEVVIPSGITVGVDVYISAANNAAAKSILSTYGNLQLRAGSGTLLSLSSGSAFTTFNDYGGQIRVSSTAAGTKTIATSGGSLPDVVIIGGSSGTLALTGGGTLPRMPRPYTSGTATITFASGTTTTITSPGADDFANGTNVVTITSSTGASAATISKANGLVRGDYLSLQDLTATGGAVFSAGANSTNVSGNTGWTFTAAAGWVPQALMTA